MPRKIATFAALVFLVLGCSRSNKMQRGQQQYQVVQEGSASGVTSTINGPGETPPPLTDTNVDTTTNFTLPTNPNPLGNDAVPGSMASSYPATPSYPAGTPGMPPASRPRTPTRDAPVVTDTIGSTTPPMPKERPAPPPEQTDTSTTTTTSAPPPSETTDTTSSTTTSSDAKKKDSDQPTPPPPPPPTDTRG